MSLRKRLFNINNELNQPDELTEVNSSNELIKYNFNKRLRGLSVIIPVYKGEIYLPSLIKCLMSQNGDIKNVEYLFILNGDAQSILNDEQIIKKEIKKNVERNSQFHIYHSEKGASNARNKGLSLAKYSHIFFLDCDDYINDNFIQNCMELLDYRHIIMTDLYDVEFDNRKNYVSMHDQGSNVIQQDMKKFEGTITNDFLSISKALSMNGAKIIPIHMILKHNIFYDNHLNSGEDIVFMMEVIVKNKPLIYITDEQDNLIYYRVISPNSVSRQNLNYSFSVLERKKVINKLSFLLSGEDDNELRLLIKGRMNAQASFINKYLCENRNEHERVVEELEDVTKDYLPFQHINRNLANTLYIGYCFPPYSDPSGIVLAKRVRERKEVVDVISHDMYKVRDVDFSLNKIARQFIDEHFILSGLTSFRNWKEIEQFIIRGLSKFEAKGKRYNKVYSRVLWPASHFLAYEIKKRDSKIFWSAEFSDPSLYDSIGQVRHSNINTVKYLKKLSNEIPKEWNDYIDENIFNLVEIIPFIFADEVIFTNINQMNIMIERIKDSSLKDYVMNKSKIEPHPLPDKIMYHARELYFPLDKNYEHVGYFGSFYENRTVEHMVKMINKHYKHINIVKPIQLHIFTNQGDVKKFDNTVISNVNVKVYRYRPYLEFLNILNKFDYLVIMDTITKGFYSSNPYLPSKLSDYLNSNAEIIAFVEKGSPMYYREDISYKIEID